jgi:hypothetical protein
MKIVNAVSVVVVIVVVVSCCCHVASVVVVIMKEVLGESFSLDEIRNKCD